MDSKIDLEILNPRLLFPWIGISSQFENSRIFIESLIPFATGSISPQKSAQYSRKIVNDRVYASAKPSALIMFIEKKTVFKTGYL